MAAFSVPRGGGELRREPMTEKRNRAHTAAVDRGGVRVMMSPHAVGEKDHDNLYTPAGRRIAEHLLRAAGARYETAIRRPPAIVIGARKRRSRAQSSSSGPRLRSAVSSARGTVATSTTGASRARASFQKGVWGKWSRQKTCQRAMVRRSAPKSWASSRTRRGEGPCRRALIKRTTAPR